MPIGRRTARAIAAGALAIFGCGGPGHAPPTFAAGAAAAVATLEHRFYHAPGSWNACLPATACGTIANDWGADALTAALVFRRRVAHDDGVLPYLRALGAAAVTYGTCRLPLCTMWSDVPLWDAVADVRVYAATADPAALKKAQRAFAAVDGSDAFARGACADIDYQQPGGGSNRLKTLETDSNYITAALLLYRTTRDRTYLAKARAKYRAVRRRFLDSRVPLYTVYLFDDGTRCAPLPHRFFASVNGIMIAAGLALTALTGEPGFAHQARETARAAAARLTDAAGVPADLQAGNDIGGPLVEAMAGIAAAPGGAFARHWLFAAARAARPAASGAFGRFFDGPPPGGPVSAWSADGGLELAIAAGALDPGRRPGGDGWAAARFVAAPPFFPQPYRGLQSRSVSADTPCMAQEQRVRLDTAFDDAGLLAILENLRDDPAGYDALGFGLVAMDTDGTVIAYNEREAEFAGIDRVYPLGLNFFSDVAPCTNNYLVSGRFDDAGALDETIGYIFTVRMSPVRVRLRMLKAERAARQYLAVDW